MRKLLLTLSCLIPLQLSLLPAQQHRILSGVHVIDVENGTVLRDMYVLISDDKIAAIESNHTSLPPVSAELIPLDGKFLMPGLWDMHAHNWNREFFKLLIANGVTGIRGMYDPIDSLPVWRVEIAVGNIQGPTIYSSGPMIDGPNPVWPGAVSISEPWQVWRAVDSLNGLGVDFIKVYSMLPREAYFELAEACKSKDIPFAGHIPGGVSLTEAIDVGQRSSEHFYGILAASNQFDEHFMAVMRGEREDSSLTSFIDIRKFLLNHFSEQKAIDLYAKLSESDTWICPTLVVNRAFGMMDDDNFLADKRLNFIPPEIKNRWNPQQDLRMQFTTQEQFRVERQLFQLAKNQMGNMERNGVKILAGTDFPNPYVFPGFSLHDELELMVQGGMSTLGALQTATLNPAIFLNKTEEYGTIEVGKYADLIILNQNPLENISHTRSIETVILKGRWLDKKSLDQMLKSLEVKYNKLSIVPVLLDEVQTNGVQAAILDYYRLRQRNADEYNFDLSELNTLGYTLLYQQNQISDAMEIFRLNIQMFPDAFQVYESLGEAFEVNKQWDEALIQYEKSLSLNPVNQGLQQKVIKLRLALSAEQN